MNREIKFRGLCSDGKWYVGYYVKDYEGIAYITSLDGTNTVEVDPKTVGEYFYVANKEFYEGDIIKEVYHPLGSDKTAYEYSNIGVITFSDNCLGVIMKIEQGMQLIPEKCFEHQKNYRKTYKHPTEGTDWFSKWPYFHRFEKIGNIYENPELLNAKP